MIIPVTGVPHNVVSRVTGTADEIHWTFTGLNSVSVDWRGTATEVHDGISSAYGTVAIAQPPSPMPFSSSGPFWEAQLTGLQPKVVYHYSIGSAPDKTFRTPPQSGTTGFTVDAEGDIGGSNSLVSVPVVQHLIADDLPAFVLILGDLTYGNQTGQSSVDQHFNDVMVWSQNMAYMPAWGNHEWDVPAKDDLRNYKGRFELPNQQMSTRAPSQGCCGKDWYWWSDYRAMHFGILKLHFTRSEIRGEFACGPAGGGKNDAQCTFGSVVDRFTLPARRENHRRRTLHSRLFDRQIEGLDIGLSSDEESA